MALALLMEDECCVFPFEPGTKRQSMQQKRRSSPSAKRSSTFIYSGHDGLLRDAEDIVPVGYFQKGHTLQVWPLVIFKRASMESVMLISDMKTVKNKTPGKLTKRGLVSSG